MGIWNAIAPEHGIDIEELRRMGLLSSEGSNPAIDNAIPNTPAANPSLRRMVSEGSLAAAADDGTIRGTVHDPRYELPDGGFDSTPVASREGRNVDFTGPDQGLTPPGYEFGEQRPTGSRASLEQLNMNRDMPANVEKEKRRGKLSRLWRGMGDAWDNWSGKGGLGGLLGEMLDQGISEARSPQKRAERVKKQGLEKFWNRYTEDLGIETAEQKRQLDMINTAKAGNAYTQQKYKPLVDGMTADDRVTDDEAALSTGLGIPMLPYDASQRDLEWVNGKPMTRRKKGGDGYTRDVTLPDDTGRTRQDVTIQAGGKDITLPLTPKETADTLIGAADRAERAQQFVAKQEAETADKEYKDQKEYQDDVRSWSQRQVKAKAQKAKAQKYLEAQRAALDDPENQASRGDIVKAIAQAEGDIAEADELLKEKKPARVIRKKPSGGKGKETFTNADIERVIQGK